MVKSRGKDTSISPLSPRTRLLADNSPMRDARTRRAIILTAATLLTSGLARAQTPDASDLGYYGGDEFGQHFSSLDEINRKTKD